MKKNKKSMTDYTIEDIIGWKQLTDDKDLKGKTIFDVVQKYDDMWILFTDKTFVHLQTTSGEYIEIYGRSGTRIDSYRELFDVMRGGREGWSIDNPHFELSKLGKSFGANLDILIEQYKECNAEMETERNNREYQQFLKLKAKYEPTQSDK